MIYGEDLRLSIRGLLGRPAESLLLVVAVAFAVGATVTGITLAGAAATISERLLSSLRYREIVVTTTVSSTTMESPARKTPARNVELTREDLDRARTVTQAVQYAYMAEETRYHLTETGVLGPEERGIRVVKVTPDYFAARELHAAAGSLFTPDDWGAESPSWSWARSLARRCSRMGSRSTARSWRTCGASASSACWSAAAPT